MNYIVSIVAAVIGLLLGNWLSLILYFPALMIFGKISPEAKGQKSATMTLYLSRACMGITISILFWIFSYFGAIRFVLTFVFGAWVFLLSEPFSEVQAHDIFKGDLNKYKSFRWKLMITRIVSYFVASFIIMGLVYRIDK